MTRSSSDDHSGRLVKFRLELILVDELRMSIEEADGDLRALVIDFFIEHEHLRTLAKQRAIQMARGEIDVR